MKYFLEISKVPKIQDSQMDKENFIYYLTHKNWYDWNKPGNWSDVGLLVGDKESIWKMIQSFKYEVEYIFGKEHIIEYIRNDKIEELGI